MLPSASAEEHGIWAPYRPKADSQQSTWFLLRAGPELYSPASMAALSGCIGIERLATRPE